jgi:hypothetical protein
MRAFALIQLLTSGDAAGFWGPPKGFFRRQFSHDLERWLDRHGAALGAILVVLTFVGTVDVFRHLLALL